MDQSDFDLLNRLEAGESVFRPEGRTALARERFAQVAEWLMGLRLGDWFAFRTAASPGTSKVPT